MTSRIVLHDSDIARALTRISHEILESNKGPDGLVLLGIPTRGVTLAERIAALIASFTGATVPVGALDVTMYRDDLHRNGGAFGRPFPRPRFKLARRDAGARLQLDVTHRQLAGIGVGLADDGREAHRGMLEQDVLDRTGIDIVAATDHQILRAPGDPEQSVLVEAAEIA